MENSYLKLDGAPKTILIIDDDEMNCDILSAIFDSEHKIITAENGRDGLAKFDENINDICAILLDVEMPVMNGMEVLKILNSRNVVKQKPVFLITGSEGVTEQAYALGVMDVISKPFLPPIVKRRVHSVMELFAARNHFEDLVNLRTDELRKTNLVLEELNFGMIEALATATEFRSMESGEHVLRIHDITELFLSASPLSSNFSDTEISNIANAAILHDIGKIAIPDSILNKPGRLSNEEFTIMKEHTLQGHKMLKQIKKLKLLPFYEHACNIARHHHERWDGSGYPDGLKGDDIPLSAQIVSIADVYDALVSARIYKPAIDHGHTVEMITQGKCGVFNPLLMQYFIDIAPTIRKLYKPDLTGMEHNDG